jgi:hypothetical protein
MGQKEETTESGLLQTESNQIWDLTLNIYNSNYLAKWYQMLTVDRYMNYLQLLYKQVSQQSTLSWRTLLSSQICPETSFARNNY